MPTFRVPCSPFYQGEEQPEIYQAAPVGISRMDLGTEETRETYNLYIESTRGSLKNIYVILIYSVMK